MPTKECIFDKIISGEIPSYKIYEDDLVYSFLDINPVGIGHTLVIPKEHYERVDELPEETAAAIGRALPKIAAAVIAATGTTAYNILVNTGKSAGQVVPHVHFHIIPKHTKNSTGLPIQWPARPIKKNDAEKLHAAITKALG